MKKTHFPSPMCPYVWAFQMWSIRSKHHCAFLSRPCASTCCSNQLCLSSLYYPIRFHIPSRSFWPAMSYPMIVVESVSHQQQQVPSTVSSRWNWMGWGTGAQQLWVITTSPVLGHRTGSPSALSDLACSRGDGCDFPSLHDLFCAQMWNKPMDVPGLETVAVLCCSKSCVHRIQDCSSLPRTLKCVHLNEQQLRACLQESWESSRLVGHT